MRKSLTGRRVCPPTHALTWEPPLAEAARIRDGVLSPALPPAPSGCRRAPEEEAEARVPRGCEADPSPALRVRRERARVPPRSEGTQESLRRFPLRSYDRA